jgi:hypothetical protein
VIGFASRLINFEASVFTMKIILRNFLIAVALTVGVNTGANAQWTIFTDIFTQMDDGTNDFFFDNLDSLANAWNNEQGFGDELGDLLNGNLLDSVPPLNLDSNYFNEVGSGIDSFLLNLPGFGLSNSDNDSIEGELDRLFGIFDMNFDSLGGIFGQYQDSLGNFPTNYLDPTILGYDPLLDQQYNYLLDSLNLIGDLSNPNGPGNITGLMSKLFDKVLFPDLEIAFGTQSSDLKYFEDQYSAEAKVIRIGSVPRFDKRVSSFSAAQGKFPIEARWHMQASWTGKAHYYEAGAPVNENLTIDPNDTDKDFNPLMMYGDFAIMTTPSLGTLGNTSFKMLVSLGTEIGTYAPAHREYYRPVTANNKGYMTGLGAQAGAGVAFTTGAITAYSMGTFAQGQALRCPVPYPYTSRRFEVGVRYGNIVNMRYSTGFTSWQSDANRQADIKNQFTVGIILSELHR